MVIGGCLVDVRLIRWVCMGGVVYVLWVVIRVVLLLCRCVEIMWFIRLMLFRLRLV